MHVRNLLGSLLSSVGTIKRVSVEQKEPEPVSVDGWVRALTLKERNSVADALKNALPEIAPHKIEAGAMALCRAIENALTLSVREPLKFNRLRALSSAAKQAERCFDEADRARIRLQKSLKVVPREVEERLTERVMESAETVGEAAATRPWKLGYGLRRIISQLDELGAALEHARRLTRPLERALHFGIGRPRKTDLAYLTIEVALRYHGLSPRKTWGLSTDPLTGNLNGKGYELALAVLRVAFPEDCRKPPDGVIRWAFRQAKKNSK